MALVRTTIKGISSFKLVAARVPFPKAIVNNIEFSLPVNRRYRQPRHKETTDDKLFFNMY